MRRLDPEIRHQKALAANAAYRASHREEIRAKDRARNAKKRTLRLQLQAAAPPYVPPTEKVCTRCKCLKPLTAFYTQPRSRDGVTAQCRTCHGQVQTEYRQRNKEQLRLADQKNMRNAWR